MEGIYCTVAVARGNLACSHCMHTHSHVDDGYLLKNRKKLNQEHAEVFLQKETMFTLMQFHEQY